MVPSDGSRAHRAGTYVVQQVVAARITYTGAEDRSALHSQHFVSSLW